MAGTTTKKLRAGLARGDMARKKRAQMLRKKASRKPKPLKRFTR